MPDNPPSAAVSSWFALSDHRLLSLTGPDALAFAQSQFMNDLSALADGRWQWNGWLTPKGRVIALFALLRITQDTLWLVLPDADPASLAAALQRFVFRSKVRIELRDDLRVAGRFGAPERASGPDWVGSTAPSAEDVELDVGGVGGERTLRIVTAASAPAENSAAQAAWKRLDLIHGWPRLNESQREQWTPQQLSLERLGAYSVKKGCYPGQEIVARTHFLGQAKRGLALLRAQTPLACGTALEHDGRALGTVISTADDLALAVVALDASSAETAAPEGESPAMGGASWTFMPMFDGLKR